MVPCDSSESKVTNYWTQEEREKDLKTGPVAGQYIKYGIQEDKFKMRCAFYEGYCY